MKAKIISLFHYLLVFLLIIFNTSCQAKSINIVDTNNNDQIELNFYGYKRKQLMLLQSKKFYKLIWIKIPILPLPMKCERN